ncbi:MAG TPA: SpoIIE family protein phosphatase [Vicinamibacterales bacterium]|nr:SpoIIE family protein phosphatase [Vicinamibacterales bacterium]
MTIACAVQPRILIADDQRDLLDALHLLLKGEGIAMDAVTSPEAVVDAVARATYDLLLMDLNYTGDTTSGREGIDLLARVQERDRLLPVVVMTGWGSVDLAVETMRRGVCDFVQKPWDNAQLVNTLRNEIEKGRTRRRTEALEARALEEARRIQRKLLPATLPQIHGCEIAASWQPAAGVGGDCFDAIAFGTSRLSLSIADVVGKGIPAALLMSNLQAAVRAFATETTTAGELCQQVNRILCGNIAEGRFISFFYCTVDTEQRTLTYANAGHYPPILVHADGSTERLSTGGPVLGPFAEATYDERQIAIVSGDRLVLFTDGITEVRPAGVEPDDPDHVEFGDDALVAAAVEHRVCSAPILEARLTSTVSAYAGGTFQDDATLMILAVD